MTACAELLWTAGEGAGEGVLCCLLLTTVKSLFVVESKWRHRVVTWRIGGGRPAALVPWVPAAAAISTDPVSADILVG
jgi:hypothetical protein